VTEFEQTLPTAKHKWRSKMVRMGFGRSMLALTAFSVCLSLLLTYPMLVYVGVPATRMLNALLITVAVSMVVAPLAGYAFITLLFELETATAALTRLATHDGLTDVFNRRYFDSRFSAESMRAMRSKLPMSVLMIDVDHFKAINDSHGHAVGDQILQDIAVACAACLRPYDMLARYGGEEFVALLPSTTMEHACEVAERVRVAVNSLKIVSPLDTVVPVTISLGVGTLMDDDSSAQQVLLRADKALYNAKSGGRNRWSVEMQ
jgi:diguanylate cyclase (GGDEF)-like protein